MQLITLMTTLLAVTLNVQAKQAKPIQTKQAKPIQAKPTPFNACCSSPSNFKNANDFIWGAPSGSSCAKKEVKCIVQCGPPCKITKRGPKAW